MRDMVFDQSAMPSPPSQQGEQERRLQDELIRSGALTRHIDAIAKELGCVPQVEECRVESLSQPGNVIPGYFVTASRTVVLDFCEATVALEDGHYSLTLLHELVHAAQPQPGPDYWHAGESEAEFRLMEGATDAVAALVWTDHDRAARPLDLPERHGSLYAVWEAVVRAVLKLADPDNSLALRAKFALLCEGERIPWIASHLAPGRERELSRLLAELLAMPTPQWDVSPTSSMWELEKACTGRITAWQRGGNAGRDANNKQ